jgi:hypothetical protein
MARHRLAVPNTDKRLINEGNPTLSGSRASFTAIGNNRLSGVAAHALLALLARNCENGQPEDCHDDFEPPRLKPYPLVLMNDIFDLTRSPVMIAPEFWDVRYDHNRYPGVAVGLAGGANCQQYAYEFLRSWAFKIPDFRSSDLWQDTEYTVTTDSIECSTSISMRLGPTLG